MENLEQWATFVEEIRRKIEASGANWDEVLVVMALREHKRQREHDRKNAA